MKKPIWLIALIFLVWITVFHLYLGSIMLMIPIAFPAISYGMILTVGFVIFIMAIMVANMAANKVTRRFK